MAVAQKAGVKIPVKNAAGKTPKQKNAPKAKPPPKQKNPGRPKKSIPVRAFRGFKTASTGETRNSPMTDPNIIFWLGIALIIAAGWSSGRLKNVFSTAWNGQAGTSWFTQIKVFGSQFLFLFIMVITARAIPPLARVWLIMIAGMWILYLMKNPQIVQLLNWTSVGATNQDQYNQFQNNLIPSIGGPRGNVK